MIPSDDSFISDDEEEYCPLCVEEMDISDKNFKPCPCGYQICQFCYNNLRQNPQLVPKCPGCRRLYDDESVEYKTITPEEYRLQQLKREKKERDRKQREKEKKESELANKKHLAGLRVVQKNLVYVTGLNPPCSPDDLHSVLRSDKYFGQYGKITKIVINKKAPNPGQQGNHQHQHQNSGLVVYVTFSRKEDALRCINELDGSLCDGRVLRAAHGTTKYCSSYLRGHPCPNPNCMFLHEPGEEADSYTRKDLSTHQGIKMGMMGMNRNNSNSNLFSSYEEQEEEPVVALPATAHWGDAASSAQSSPQVTNTPLANSAAFPTLSEIFKDQKHQQKKEPSKPKSKSKSKEGLMAADDVDVDDDSAIQFLEDSTKQLKQLTEGSELLDIHFNNLGSQANLPMFSFKPDLAQSSSEGEKDRARLVIERFLFRPIKNYHLAYINHPITQLLQQQQQQQQRQQQTAQLQQLQLEHQKRTHQQQAQQQLLLLQLQQQAAKQQQQQQQQGPLLQAQPQPAGQINILRMNDRVQSSSTPPPPGLFAGNAGGQAKASQVPQYPSQSFPEQSPTGGANQSTSSQLLSQLMGGKR